MHILPQWSRGHNHQELRLTCRHLRGRKLRNSCTTCRSYRTQKITKVRELVRITGKNISYKIKHDKNILRLKVFKK